MVSIRSRFSECGEPSDNRSSAPRILPASVCPCGQQAPVFRAVRTALTRREVRDLAVARLLVKPFRVALFANSSGALTYISTNSPSLRIERARRRSSRYGEINAVITSTPASIKQLRHFADTADVFRAVLRRESEVGAEAVADVVAVEHICVQPHRKQLALKLRGNRRLARARQAREPDDSAFMALRASRMSRVTLPFVQKMFWLLMPDNTSRRSGYSPLEMMPPPQT